MKHKDMGKAWKKIAAVVLTAAMVISASAVSVLATTDTQQFSKDNSTDTFSITIKPNNDAATTDADFTEGTDTTFDEDRGLHEYSAYQIFKGDLVEKTAAGAGTNTDGTAVESTHADKILSNIEWGTAIPEDNRVAFITALNTKFSFGLATDAKAFEVAEKIATLLDSTTASADSSALADIIGEYASVVATGETPTAAQTNASDPVTLKVSGPGYYFVKDTTITEGNKPYAYTDYILQVLSNVIIQTKSDVPTVQKKVDDVDDTTGSEDTITWQDSADYDVGDKIEYKITGTLPDNLDVYSTYSYKFTDSMSSGLKYNEDAKVYAYLYTLGHDTDENPTFSNPAWYDVTSWFSLNVTGDTTLTIAAKSNTNPVADNDIKQINSGKALTIPTGKTLDTATLSEIVSASEDTTNLVLVSNKTISTPSSIVVRYTCNLDIDAVIGSTGNPNTVKLEFSNNPNAAGTGETIEDKVIVFTYEVDVNKVKESATAGEFDPLVGADFRLDKFYKSYTAPAGTYYIDTTNKVIMKAVDGYHYAQNTAGEVKLIKNGEAVTGFTDIAATTLTEPTIYENHWVEVDSTSGTLGTDSTFKFERIDAGNYKITEIVTPAGYNSVEPITFTVVADHETKAEVPKLTKLQVTNISPTSITFAVDGIEADNGGALVTQDETKTTTGVISTDVVNKAGVELPSTGGMGTTLFYVIGAILVIGAGVVLVTRRRMA